MDIQSIVVALVVLAVTLYVARAFLLGGAGVGAGLLGGSADSVLLMSATSGTGTTRLFTYIRDGALAQTYTSMQENCGRFLPCLPGLPEEFPRALEYVDVPSNAGVRTASLEARLKSAKGCVVLVSAAASSAEVDRAGQMLYDVLRRAAEVRPTLPVLVCVVAGEAKKSQSNEALQRGMEDRVVQAIANQQSIPDLDGNVQEGAQPVHFSGDAFSFQTSQCPISMGNIALKSPPSLAGLADWLVALTK
jgi:hypothetical protein